jgi:hypothetical protein
VPPTSVSPTNALPNRLSIRFARCSREAAIIPLIGPCSLMETFLITFFWNARPYSRVEIHEYFGIFSVHKTDFYREIRVSTFLRKTDFFTRLHGVTLNTKVIFILTVARSLYFTKRRQFCGICFLKFIEKIFRPKNVRSECQRLLRNQLTQSHYVACFVTRHRMIKWSIWNLIPRRKPRSVAITCFEWRSVRN